MGTMGTILLFVLLGCLFWWGALRDGRAADERWKAKAEADAKRQAAELRTQIICDVIKARRGEWSPLYHLRRGFAFDGWTEADIAEAVEAQRAFERRGWQGRRGKILRNGQTILTQRPDLEHCCS